MRFLRSNTAVITTVGPFFDATDGVTIEGALTITNERITLTADTDDGAAPTNILDNVTGATSGTANDLNYITGTDAGLMQLELSAANVNRLGRMFLTITDAANHVPVFHEYMVVNTTLYDAFFASSGGAIPNIAAAAVGGLVTAPTTANTALADVTRLLGTAWLAPGTAGTPDVNAKLHGGTAQTGRDIGASVLLSSGTGTGQISLSSGKVTLSNPCGLQKNTAASAFTFFLASSADHVTAKTGATVTAQRSLDGAAFGNCANAVSEIANGFYKVDLAAADLNADVVALKFTATGADQLSITIITEP